jgi:hypothetical protein
MHCPFVTSQCWVSKDRHRVCSPPMKIIFRNHWWGMSGSGTKWYVYTMYEIILSPWEENTHGVYLFILNIDLLQMDNTWNIYTRNNPHVGYECIKHSASEGLHLWRNWWVLFLIWRSTLTVRTASTKIVIILTQKFNGCVICLVWE